MWEATKVTTPTMALVSGAYQSPLYGAALCPQPVDVCDAGTAVMAGKKTKTFAKAGESATVTIKGAAAAPRLSAAVACSYLVEATCDAPYA